MQSAQGAPLLLAAAALQPTGFPQGPSESAINAHTVRIIAPPLKKTWQKRGDHMYPHDVIESDWKLFRKKPPGWQEAYMDKLNQDYIRLLTGPGDASDKFWELEKRIKDDKKDVGVVAEMRRSVMFPNLIDLLREGAITLDDLEGFSDELRESLAFVTRSRK